VSAEQMRTGSRPRVRVTTSHAPPGGNLRGCGESNPDPFLLGADQGAQGRQRLGGGREPVGQSLAALALATSSRTGGEVPCVTRTSWYVRLSAGVGAVEAERDVLGHLCAGDLGEVVRVEQQ
jgi:hypothetical protein